MATTSFSELIAGDQAVLIDFHAEWCGPCQMMPPILKDVKSRLGDSIKIIKIDIDKNRALAERYQVQSVPTVMIFKNGEIVWRESGVRPAHEIIKKVTSLA